jgi:glycosyltransferase involved in cell wall biosynthesis
MIKQYFVSLVMPCKNEGRALETVLGKLPKEIDEVVVVDNNSKDRTIEVAKNYNARIFKEKRSDKYGIGYGYALQKGIKEAKGTIIVCMDGDGSYPVKEIPHLVKTLIDKNFDFISCNRLPFKKPKKMSVIRASGVNILNFLTWFLYGYRIKDSLSGMWVFKRHALEELELNEGGWNLSLEIKLKSLINPSIKFCEKQISYSDRVFDVSKQRLFQTGFEHVLYLIKFRVALLKANRFSLDLNRLSEGNVS